MGADLATKAPSMASSDDQTLRFHGENMMGLIWLCAAAVLAMWAALSLLAGWEIGTVAAAFVGGTSLALLVAMGMRTTQEIVEVDASRRTGRALKRRLLLHDLEVPFSGGSVRRVMIKEFVTTAGVVVFAPYIELDNGQRYALGLDAADNDTALAVCYEFLSGIGLAGSLAVTRLEEGRPLVCRSHHGAGPCRRTGSRWQGWDSRP